MAAVTPSRPGITISRVTTSGRCCSYSATSSFAVPASGTFGNCRRNAVNGPAINTFNFSLQKNFRLAEHATLRFMGIATNALNHPIFRNPNTTITSGGFGQITGVLGSAGTNRDTVGAAGSRLIQLGARIDF